MTKLTEDHARVLAALNETGEYNYLTFNGIALRGAIDRHKIRRITRFLARKGFAEFGKGLWNDDGPAGAGYCITPAGRDALAALGQEGRDGTG